ncbi:leucyl/phenylalanyl-tRNA--protein transferase [Adhaeretor mobilis]|uniref:Leucyl/phenylalanyl-tRNA--protein transferase n=1 Tax=Adhaeretor mobilis TaxID=1930276 RepID=A0A517MUV7_9BACT|nr:leucyl/phenylalanyl-tRNA--protein transferase [Adhaeretor mobilis]QDS98577.1 Leucyl/phenylalanyl-tRNA--protein transferase [Adhaeretor mobilis]
MTSKYFPDPADATPDGLVGIGGDLTPDRLLDAYRHGIFPWPTYAEDPMLWWSPDPRALMPLEGMHVSRRLSRRLKSNQFTHSVDKAFAQVIHACSVGPGREGGTWLTEEMLAAYVHLHKLGHAHSVEVWQEGELAGGVYGVAVGGVFAAESMFHRVRDASKVALYRLIEHLNARGYQMLDIQQWTDHTGSLGAIEVPRRDYLKRLEQLVDLPVSFCS